mgnify:FL=1
MDTSIKDIDSYIRSVPEDMRERMEKMRSIIQKAAPKATEAIKYGMPTFVHHGNVVHFAACKSHVGFYPAPSGIVNFAKELKGYTCSKGSIHLPLDKPLPAKLITAIVKFRMKENEGKAKGKGK